MLRAQSSLTSGRTTSTATSGTPPPASPLPPLSRHCLCPVCSTAAVTKALPLPCVFDCRCDCGTASPCGPPPGKLELAHTLLLHDGAGPRHMCFAPDSGRAYVQGFERSCPFHRLSSTAFSCPFTVLHRLLPLPPPSTALSPSFRSLPLPSTAFPPSLPAVLLAP